MAPNNSVNNHSRKLIYLKSWNKIKYVQLNGSNALSVTMPRTMNDVAERLLRVFNPKKDIDAPRAQEISTGSVTAGKNKLGSHVW